MPARGAPGACACSGVPPGDPLDPPPPQCRRDKPPGHPSPDRNGKPTRSSSGAGEPGAVTPPIAGGPACRDEIRPAPRGPQFQPAARLRRSPVRPEPSPGPHPTGSSSLGVLSDALPRSVSDRILADASAASAPEEASPILAERPQYAAPTASHRTAGPSSGRWVTVPGSLAPWSHPSPASSEKPTQAKGPLTAGARVPKTHRPCGPLRFFAGVPA